MLIQSRVARLILPILVGLLVSCGGNGKTEEELRAAAYREAREAYEKAEGIEEKQRLVEDFLSQHPKTSEAFRLIRIASLDLYLDRMDDPAGAVEFAEKNLAEFTDEEMQQDGRKLLISLYGKNGNQEKIRALVSELGNDLTATDELEICQAARDAKDWELLAERSAKAVEKATLENVRAYFDDEEEESLIELIYNYERSDSLMMKALSEFKRGDFEAALKNYELSSQFLPVNFVGLGFGDLNLLWAEALIQQEEYEQALNVTAREALLGGAEEALELFRKAYLGNGGREDEFSEYSAQRRQEVSPEMLPFTAYDYEGGKVAFSDLKGKVTLLAFWFPT